MNWSLITASNDETVLRTCLAASPCVGPALDFNVMRGFRSAAAAYNAGMRQASGEILVFAHQDVYLPPGWDTCLEDAVSRLATKDPGWAVLGIWGITRELQRRGYMYCTGLQKVLGTPFEEPIECVSLDEVLLVLRRSAGLVFDEQLPGFHLYGTDICLEAQRRGLRSYLVPAFCVHNTEGLDFLPSAFWHAYFYLRRKWRDQLPVRTPCTTITRWAWPVLRSVLASLYVNYLKRERPGQRVPDPAAFYQNLLHQRILAASDVASPPSSSARKSRGVVAVSTYADK